MSRRVFEQIRAHDFHPLEAERPTFTVDRTSGASGVADLDDPDGRIRSLAVRDLVAATAEDPEGVVAGLADEDLHVRYLSAAALGVARVAEAREALEALVRDDPAPIVRLYAAIALGEMGPTASLDLLRERHTVETNRDVRHQLELAAAQIEAGARPGDAQRDAFLSLRESDFGRVRVGSTAPDFTLDDTEGGSWSLAAFGGHWRVLVWVFADWCPVCHREFAELMELRREFAAHDVQVVTLEAHDTWRGRLMVGREIQPELWGSRRWFVEAYTERIWWSHLLDRAGAVGARYGTQPMAFAVHGEFVNRPTTVIVDPEGVVRFAHAGMFWGDRPSVEQTLDMIRRERFDFEHVVPAGVS
jgi:thiol-disulfide isomerase/thioredoxin